MYLIWNDIKFISKKEIDFEKDILQSRLITIPAAPAFVENRNNMLYYKALRSSTFSIIDSSYFAILCKLSGYNVYKYSGYKLIFDMIKYLKTNKLKIHIISPNNDESININNFLLENTLLSNDEVSYYNAPFYPKNEEIKDYDLIKSLELVKPDITLVCIAGGKQEILGEFLKNNLTFKSTILCTGAAISFFTGSQAKVSPNIDKYYLGWLARIFASPKIFIPRYFNALKFIFIFFQFKITTKNYKK